MIDKKEVKKTSRPESKARKSRTDYRQALKDAANSLNPLRRYSPDEQAGRWIVVALAFVVGMSVGFILAAMIGISLIISLVLAMLVGTAFAALITWYFNLSSTPPVSEQPAEESSDPLLDLSPNDMATQYITANPVTRKLAEKNQRNLPPGASPTKWLLPADLEHTLYDQRHHVFAVRRVFIAMFTRQKEGNRKKERKHWWNLKAGGRAMRNMFLYWVFVMGTLLVAYGLLFDYDTGPTFLTVAVCLTLGYIVMVLYGVWHCLTHVRLVVTKRITAEIHDTWPWAPSRWTYVYSVTLTESTYEQGFFARLLRFSHHRIETTEQQPMLTSWHYARHPTRLDYVLNSVNPNAHMLQE